MHTQSLVIHYRGTRFSERQNRCLLLSVLEKVIKPWKPVNEQEESFVFLIMYLITYNNNIIYTTNTTCNTTITSSTYITYDTNITYTITDITYNTTITYKCTLLLLLTVLS